MQKGINEAVHPSAYIEGRSRNVSKERAVLNQNRDFRMKGNETLLRFDSPVMTRRPFVADSLVSLVSLCLVRHW